MKRLLTLLLVLVPLLASSQTLHLAFGPSFSLMRPADSYSAQSVDAKGFSWPKVVTIAGGQKWDKGYSGLVRVRFQLPATPLSIMGGFAYTRLVGESESVLATVPPYSSLAYQSGRLETKADLIGVNGAIRWDMLRAAVTPYVITGATYNRFGETTLTVLSDEWISKGTVKAMSRVGLAFEGGVSFILQSSVRLEAELGYALPNAFGREDGEEIHHAISVALLFSCQVF